VVSSTPRPHFTSGKDPIPILQEARWGRRADLDGRKNLVPTGIPSPDLPARSQSLYPLSYPAHARLRNIGVNIPSDDISVMILNLLLRYVEIMRNLTGCVN